MKNFKMLVGLMAGVAVAGLSACGGGGGGSAGGSTGTTSGQSAAATKFSQSDIKDIAEIGLVSNLIVKERLAPTIVATGAILGAFSIDTSGAGTHVKAPAACLAGGTETSSITKTSAHVGLVPGDQVTISFNKCATSSSQFLIDGTVKLIVKSAISLLSIDNFSVAFEADMTALSSTLLGTTTTYSGSIDAQLASSSSTDSVDVKGTVSKAPGVNIKMQLPQGSVTFGLLPSASFEEIEFNTARRASIKLDGDISANYRSQLLSFSIATPAPIAGPLGANEIDFTGTSGTVNTTWTASKLPTSVSFSGSTAKVSGDSDGDGTMDIVFNSTWAELL